MVPKNSHRIDWLIGLTALSLGVALTLLATVAHSQKVRSDEEVARILAIEQLSVQESGVVRGQVHNKSNHAVREVEIFIRYTWLWEDERNPGKVDPGTSTYFRLKETINPGNSTSFIYKPSPPLPKIAGGRFETSVKIAGFSEIIPQNQ